MKPSLALLTLSTFALILGDRTAAKAEELALSFDLKPISTTDTSEPSPAAIAAPSVELNGLTNSLENATPLPVPSEAATPPMRGDEADLVGGHGGGQSWALGDRPSKPILPPAPALSSQPIASQPVASQSIEAKPNPVSSLAQSLPPVQSLGDPDAPELIDLVDAPEPIDELLLGFDLELLSNQASNSPSAFNLRTGQLLTATEASTTAMVSQLFAGGAESLVARAVGSAEGTRTPEGYKTPAYFGHVDPGNGVWNLGTFSFQHTANSPEEADAKQLSRLKLQTSDLRRKAQASGLELSLEELVNGIDLANQAPLAALDREGYLDWLAKARRLGMTGADAIVWARTRSFIDPDTRRWNAPGLGNNIYSISRDQLRRAQAIARAIEAEAIALPDQAADDNSDTQLLHQQTDESFAEAEPEAIALLFNPSFIQSPQLLLESELETNLNGMSDRGIPSPQTSELETEPLSAVSVHGSFPMAQEIQQPQEKAASQVRVDAGKVETNPPEIPPIPGTGLPETGASEPPTPGPLPLAEPFSMPKVHYPNTEVTDDEWKES